MILVDASVWIDHLRKGSPRLTSLLLDEQVVSHPLVIGELACGLLKNRHEILRLLQALPSLPSAAHHEVLTFIEAHRLYGQGLGFADAHLLAAAMLDRTGLWTLDKTLHRMAVRLGIPSCAASSPRYR